MRILAISLSLGGMAFMVHWIVWRVRIPTRQSATLIAIFSATLLIGLVGSRWWPPSWRLHGPWEVLHVVLFHVAIMLAYVVAYSALEERSPSMTILSRVADAGRRGRSREDLESLLVRASPVEIRLAAMVRDGMARESDHALTLTAKGWAWANTFSAWRRLLRFHLGG